VDEKAAEGIFLKLEVISNNFWIKGDLKSGKRGMVSEK
jgi:hypothetical protein